MDRRSFVLKAGTLFAALAGSRLAYADDTKKEKAKKPSKKEKKPKKSAPKVAPFVPGSWTIVILPDIQHYSEDYPGLLKLQSQWIAANKDKYNITYVLQNGDITNRSSRREWENAQKGLGILDGKVPYAIVPGNHDYEPRGSARTRDTKLNDYFSPERFKSWPTFGGTMEKGRMENNYHLFEGGGRKWIAIGLEWAPRDKTLKWLGGLLTKYADRRAIIFTHAYLYYDSTRYNWAEKKIKQRWNPHNYKTPGSKNDGEEIWQKVLRKHPNVFMAMNGHVCGDGLGFQVSKGDHGNLVNEMLVNYQVQKVGGGAWLRLLEFHPDGKTVQARTYSPLYNRFETSKENQFTFPIVDAK
jgi:hypothetical protein